MLSLILLPDSPERKEYYRLSALAGLLNWYDEKANQRAHEALMKCLELENVRSE